MWTFRPSTVPKKYTCHKPASRFHMLLIVLYNWKLCTRCWNRRQRCFIREQVRCSHIWALLISSLAFSTFDLSVHTLLISRRHTKHTVLSFLPSDLILSNSFALSTILKVLCLLNLLTSECSNYVATVIRPKSITSTSTKIDPVSAYFICGLHAYFFLHVDLNSCSENWKYSWSSRFLFVVFKFLSQLHREGLPISHIFIETLTDSSALWHSIQITSHFRISWKKPTHCAWVHYEAKVSFLKFATLFAVPTLISAVQKIFTWHVFIFSFYQCTCNI